MLGMSNKNLEENIVDKNKKFTCVKVESDIYGRATVAAKFLGQYGYELLGDALRKYLVDMTNKGQLPAIPPFVDEEDGRASG